MDGNSSPARLAWAKRRKKLFGFEPDPEYLTYQFHPEAKNAIIAFCDVSKDGVVKAGFVPCFVNKQSQPEVLGSDERGRSVASYMSEITEKAGLRAEFSWEGDRVVFFRKA